MCRGRGRGRGRGKTKEGGGERETKRKWGREQQSHNSITLRLLLFAGVEKGEEVEGDGENERERGRKENESLREENTTLIKLSNCRCHWAQAQLVPSSSNLLLVQNWAGPESPFQGYHWLTAQPVAEFYDTFWCHDKTCKRSVKD